MNQDIGLVIFETERVAGEDISSNTAPCFFYTNSLTLGTPFGIEGGRWSNNSSVMISFPRTPDGQVKRICCECLCSNNIAWHVATVLPIWKYC